MSPADADTLTISGIKVVALDSDGTGLAAPATISVQVIDDVPINFLPQNAFVLMSTAREPIIPIHGPSISLRSSVPMSRDQLYSTLSMMPLRPARMASGRLTHAGQAIHIFGNGTPLLTGYVDTDGSGTYNQGTDQDRSIRSNQRRR